MASTAEWIDELKSISVLELSERIKALEETFGVSAAAVAAAGPAGAGAGDRGGGGRGEEEPGDQGGARRHGARPEGGKGAGRRGPKAGQGGHRQGRGREAQGRHRRGRRSRGVEISRPSATREARALVCLLCHSGGTGARASASRRGTQALSPDP